MSERIHFSLGPVQEFIGESRRTRDLWVSSFVLSYLAGRAMARVVALDPAENRIELPGLGREDLAPYGDDARAALPDHAMLPNRFVARVRDGREAAEQAASAVREAWGHIADTVFREFVKPVAHHGAGSGDVTTAIWRRQVSRFWDITWVMAEDARALDERKHWRARRVDAEPGHHCTMMGAYQELSGYVTGSERERRDAFWSALRDRPRVSELNLGKDERLCAIALIKRLLPLVSEEALGRDIEEIVCWPSTLYVAAWPWIKRMCHDHAEAAAGYAKKACATRKQAGLVLGERRAGARLTKRYPRAGDFPSLEGNYMFAQALGNDRATPLDEESRRELLLHELQALIRAAGDDAPSPFFALLLMDGDHMGELLRDASGRDQMSHVTSALTRFADEVPGIVKQHEGHTVYAGGDDVLAFLPMDRATSAAIALRRAYVRCFRDSELDEELAARATLSGALLFTHYKLPLRRILRAAHTLLDDVAKAQTGRDSLAMAVHRTSGETSRWAAPWLHLCPELAFPAGAGERDRRAPAGQDEQTVPGTTGTILDALIEHIARDRVGKRFFYRLRAQLARMSGDAEERQDSLLHELGDERLTSLILAELHGDRQRRELAPDVARDIAGALLLLCRPRRRSESGDLVSEHGELILDAAFIADFLINPEEEER